MTHVPDMRELRDEERYWARLLKRANDQGQAGRTFARCLGSVRAEIIDRQRSCGCEDCLEQVGRTVGA